MNKAVSFPKLLLGLAFSLSTVNIAHADMIGLFASADYWQHNGNADIAATQTPTNNFIFNEKGNPNISIAFDHPVPFIPNIKVRYNQLSLKSHKEDAAFEYKGNVYAGPVNLTSDLTNLDAILYWRLLDNVVKVYTGLDAKQIKGKATVKGALKFSNFTGVTINGESSENLNYIIPMLYLSVGAKFPLTGLSVKAEASGMKYSNSSVTDVQAEIKYDFIENLAVNVGIKAGYRQLALDLVDVKDTDVKATIKGPYLGLEAHF